MVPQPHILPLYLHLSASALEAMDEAVKREELIAMDMLGSLMEHMKHTRRERVVLSLSFSFLIHLSNTQRKWPEEMLPNGLGDAA